MKFAALYVSVEYGLFATISQAPTWITGVPSLTESFVTAV